MATVVDQICIGPFRRYSLHRAARCRHAFARHARRSLHGYRICETGRLFGHPRTGVIDLLQYFPKAKQISLGYAGVNEKEINDGTKALAAVFADA